MNQLTYACGCTYPTNGDSAYYDHNCASCHVIAWSAAETKDDKSAAYLMRDLQAQVTDADGWHTLKDAQDYLWARIEVIDRQMESEVL